MKARGVVLCESGIEEPSVEEVQGLFARAAMQIVEEGRYVVIVCFREATVDVLVVRELEGGRHAVVARVQSDRAP